MQARSPLGFVPGSIRGRVLVGFVLMALLPALAISLVTAAFNYETGRQQTLGRLESVAALKAVQLADWAESLQDELLLATSDSDASERSAIVLDLARSDQYYSWYNQAVRSRLAILVGRSQLLQSICLLDRTGRPVLCTAAAAATSCAAAPFFQTALREPVVALPFPDAPAPAACLAGAGAAPRFAVAARPVLGEGDVVLGVVVGLADLPTLTGRLNDRTGLGETGRAYLVSTAGAVLGLSGDARDQPGASPGVAAALTSQGSASGIFAGPAGEQVMAVYRWSHDVSALLAIEQDFSEALRPLALTLLLGLGVSAAAALAAATVAVFLARSITRPLVNLVETATTIAGGDLQRVAPIARDDEIGVLARAFNSMTAQLRDLISTLEDRVAERTQAVRRQVIQLETSAAVSRQLTAILNLDDLLARVVEQIREAFGYTNVRVMLLEGDELVLRASSADTTPGIRRLSLSATSLNAEALRTSATVVAGDVRTHPAFLEEVDLPGTRSELVLPLRAGGEVIGTLDLLSDRPHVFGDADVLVLQSLGDQIAVVIENARLYARSRELAVVEERNRLARDLHDSVTQSLYSLSLLAASWRRAARAGEPMDSEANFERAAEISQLALKEMRLLLYQLRPAALERDGLVGALQTRLDAVERRAGVRARLVAEPPPHMPQQVEAELYFIAQEALNNALKHAGASELTVTLDAGDGSIVLQVYDNGRGFAPGQQGGGGMGLQSMAQRASALGASLDLISAPGKGTLITVRAPLGLPAGAVEVEQ